MSFFRSVYCYSYQNALDTPPQTDLDKVGQSGTLLVSVILLMWLFSIGFLLVAFGLGDSLIDLLQDAFGRRAGRTIGQLLALSLFLLIYPLAGFTLGSPKRFQKTIKTYQAVGNQEQRSEIALKGALGLYLSISVFVIAIIVGAIVSTF